jgi:UDP-N-acetyl-D-glucosamine dehydrogenase
VDPYYLIEKAEGVGFEHRFLKLAREINNSMPEYTVQMIIEGLNEIGKSIKGTKITVLGVSYKGGVDDTRESPALKIIEKLRNLGARLKIYDPYVKSMSNVKNIDASITSDCIVIVTDHQEFKSLDLHLLKSKGVKLIVDGRNILDKEKIKKLDIVYKGIGR